ncbi:alpha/beta fold hydrolase [Lapidilactobacillus mulanensis]|uniref:Alpha/beta fold hydrolase n=1 Tax=Lapidilactobacillus mulanensis TaxID=2485999 RepID=A0ABW4DM43_9LACO|nr:alpha/beta hydrolase [Lapidilactobacillus mulanensis]
MLEEKIIKTGLGTFKISLRAPKENPLVVFLSGAGQFDTYETFENVIDLLPESFGILAVDYLNTGHSGKAVMDYSMRQEAAAIAKMVNDQDTEKVILVAHSIGGVYALLMTDQIENLTRFVGIEPTTREIVLDPPSTPGYEAEDSDQTQQQMEDWLHDHVRKEFVPQQAAKIWQTFEASIARLDETDGARLQQVMNGAPWDDKKLKLPETLASTIITESYRVEEMNRSEFMTTNSHSKIIMAGTYHYIHWENPEVIAKAIAEL